MRGSLKSVTLAALMIGATVVTGCSTTGTAVRGPADLDTGKYLPLQAKSLPKEAVGVSWAKLRGIRLADHVVFPREVDPDLKWTRYPLQPLATPTNTAMVITKADELPVMKNFEYGYAVTAADDSNDYAYSGALFVFDSPQSATAAADAFAQSMLKNEKHSKNRSEPISGTPDGTRTVQSTGTLGETAIGITPVGSVVMYAWAQDKAIARPEAAVRTALTKQKAMLAAMPAMSDDRNPDPTGLIRGTIVSEQSGDPQDNIVYGPRGAATQFEDQPSALAAMTKAGIDRVAQYATRAYRAGSDEQATTFAQYLIGMYPTMYPTTKKAASPRDLPSARCWKADRAYGCVVAVGRYVGEAKSSTLLDAQQRISAQSVFLSKL